MHSVTVLISTYNGEKYIREQLDSLIAQEGVEVNIIARDDGSTDSTPMILTEYVNRYDNIIFYQGENLGPAYSFVDLVKCAPNVEYYAFCDQDDVWKKEKLFTAVSLLEKIDDDCPIMYYSNLFVVDESLNVIRKFLPNNYKKENKYNVIIDNMAAGCTVVFNNHAKKYVERLAADKHQYILMHDAWIHLICSFFGKVVYDHDAYIYYRQHGDNTVGTMENRSFYKMIKEKLERFFDKTIEPRRLLATSFYNIYFDLLQDEDVYRLSKLVNYKMNLKNRIDLLLDKRICAPSLKRDLRYRILILRGLA